MIGGTGPAGKGLAVRLAALGHDVTVGSRDRARGEAVAAELGERWGSRVASLQGGDNADAAACEVAVLATVADAAVDTAVAHGTALGGKVVVVVANGMEKGRRELRPVLPPEGSISCAVQRRLPEARVVTAFQHIPASDLEDLDHELGCDVLVAADDDTARVTLMDLVDSLPGLRAFDAGSLANSVGIEAFTAALITVNVRHRGHASLHLTGVAPRRAGSSGR
jgi:NADPH-dependent F420 reductase